MAFVSDLSGSPQVWRMPVSGGFPMAVTAFDEQVKRVNWSPEGEWLAVESAPGGGMNTQIDIVRPDGDRRRRITAGGASNNWLGGWTKDGRALLFSSSMEQPDTMECFRIAVDSGALDKLTGGAGTATVEDANFDGSQLLVKRVAYRGDNNVYLVNGASKGERLLTEHDPPASFENARFSHDGSAVYLISNRDTDMACLCRLSLKDDSGWQIIRAREDAELAEFALSGDGKQAALVWNVAGAHELELVHLHSAGSGRLIDLPGAIVESLRFSPDGAKLAMCLSGARLPQDVSGCWIPHSGDRAPSDPQPANWHRSLEQLIGRALAASIRAHDGLPLTGWLYMPQAGKAPYPTVLSFHGGPEGQEQPRFRYDYQALLAQGIAVFAPNVRGSSGFGKRFVNLDNGELRYDAIEDIASDSEVSWSIAAIAAAGRIGIMGGSYGGYMTMAGLAEFPEIFAAGVNLYGVVNFKTFFALTEPWMASISKG